MVIGFPVSDHRTFSKIQSSGACSSTPGKGRSGGGSLAKFPDATHPGSIIDILLVDAIMQSWPCCQKGATSMAAL